MDRIIVAFSPCEEDYATKGHVWSIYNPSLEYPYEVPEGDEKLKRAISRLHPKWYDPGDEHWIRLDYESIIEGDPEKINGNNS